MRRLTIWAALASGLAAAGCGGGDRPSPPAGPRLATELGEVAELFRLYQAEHKRPPRRLADLSRYAAGMDLGYGALQDGRVVPVWGASARSDGDGVLAYEKDAPTAGGGVVLQNGTVKELTAEEFATAPKAK